MDSSLDIKSVRGVRDILPKEQSRWHQARREAEEVARLMGFERIDVPLLEYVDIFDRSIGQETDIISKELFLVQQKEERQKRQMALRPEMTAGIARAYLQHGMGSWPQPVRLYGLGPVFRYDRPQKGRYREHTQFDLEIIGINSPAADAWVIYAGWMYFQRLGLTNVTININSLGSAECQSAFADKLVKYFQPQKERLPLVDQNRLASNPLRLLDSKEEVTAHLAEDAPQSLDCLDKDSKQFFTDVLSYLDEYGITYNLNPRIVRGLDYYTHTVFEFIIEGDSGQQGSIGGGGRYDNLISKLGGQKTAGVGMGIGLDRVILEMSRQRLPVKTAPAACEVFIIHLSKRGRTKAQTVMNTLFDASFVTLHAADKTSLRAQLKRADKYQARYAVIIGETEAKNEMCILRDMKSGIQEDVHLNDLVELLVDRLRNRPNNNAKNHS